MQFCTFVWKFQKFKSILEKKNPQTEGSLLHDWDSTHIAPRCRSQGSANPSRWRIPTILGYDILTFMAEDGYLDDVFNDLDAHQPCIVMRVMGCSALLWMGAAVYIVEALQV
jgi:hypothetical protein